MINEVLSDVRTEQLKEKVATKSDMLTMTMNIDLKDMNKEKRPKQKRAIIKILPTTAGKSAFERLGEKVDISKSQTESAFLRLGSSSVFDRLGEKTNNRVTKKTVSKNNTQLKLSVKQRLGPKQL